LFFFFVYLQSAKRKKANVPNLQQALQTKIGRCLSINSNQRFKQPIQSTPVSANANAAIWKHDDEYLIRPRLITRNVKQLQVVPINNKHGRINFSHCVINWTKKLFEIESNSLVIFIIMIYTECMCILRKIESKLRV